MPRTNGLSSRSICLAVAAICTTASFYTLLPADETALPADETEVNNHVNKIDLGVKPQITSPGVAIVPHASSTYVTFQATQYGEQGASDGLAVIRLTGCSDWKFRSAGDEDMALHTVDIEALDCCETYEVFNSDWSDFDPTSRHLIFTFLGLNPGVTEGGMNFECLAQDVTVEFFPSGPFEDILEYIDLLEAQRLIESSNSDFPVEEQEIYEEDYMPDDAHLDTDDEYYTEEDYPEFE